MTDAKSNSDGFQEIGEGEINDPLSIVKLPSATKDDTSDVVVDKPKVKTDPSMDEKLKSVFGNDVMFEDHVPKNIQVYRPKSSRGNAEGSPGKDSQISESKEAIDKNMLSPLMVPARSMDSPVKSPTQQAGMMQIKAQKSVDDENAGVGDKVAKPRYKDIVANSDEFEEDRIEAAFIGNHVTCTGTLKLGRFMVAAKIT